MPHKKKISKRGLLQEVSFTTSGLYEKSQFQPFNPNNLFQERGNYDLYDKMRDEDDQIKAVLTLKKRTVLSEGWELRLDPKGMQFERQRDILSNNLKFWLDNSFDNVLMQILTALDYGFSMSEILYEFDSKENLLWIRDIKTRPPHAFLFEQDAFGNVTKVIQQDRAFTQFEMNPAKFIHFIYQGEFQNPYGKSDLNQVYKPYWSKDIIIKFWNIYLERHATPVVKASYKRRISSEIRARTLTLLDNIQNKTSMILPEDITVDLLEAKRSSAPDFERAIDKYNLMIARALLMPDLLGLSGNQTGGGSYALGKKHFDLFLFVVTSIQHELERVINNSLVRPYFILNFGIEENFPQFRIKEVPEENKNDLAKIWIDAVTKGAVSPMPEDENHLRELIGFPDNPNPQVAKTPEEVQPQIQKAVAQRQEFEAKINPIIEKMIEDIVTTYKRKRNFNKLEVKFKKEFKTAIQSEIKKQYKRNFNKDPDESMIETFEKLSFDLVGQEAENLLKKSKDILEECSKTKEDISNVLNALDNKLKSFKSETIDKIYKDIKQAFN